MPRLPFLYRVWMLQPIYLMLFRRVCVIAKSACWLRHECLTVCLSVLACISAASTLDGFPWNLVLGTMIKTCWDVQNVVKIGQKYQAIYVKPKFILLLPTTSIHLIFISVQHSVLYCLQWHVAKQDTQNVLLRFSSNSDYANAPQCYVIRTEHRLSCWSSIWPHFYVFFSLSVYLGLLLDLSHGLLPAVDFLIVLV